MENITDFINGEDVHANGADTQAFQVIYAELRKIAAARLSREKPGQTLQPTALVHEAWMRLMNQMENSAWDSRAHFFASAAESMRRILIDWARKKATARRHPDRSCRWRPTTVPVPDLTLDELMDLDDAIERLSNVDSDTAKLVRLRLFAGLSVEEAAEVVPIPVRSAYRSWKYAQAWLFRELNSTTRIARSEQTD